MRLVRVSKDPIMIPREEVEWEKDAVFNCAMIYEYKKFHMFYRAVRHPNISAIGYAISEDGIHFKRQDKPIFRSNECVEESQGAEDPRIVKIGNTYYILYTAYDGKKCRIAMATSPNLIEWDKRGVILDHEKFGNNKDAAFFPEKIKGRYVLIHRPEPDVYLSFSDDLFNWKDHKCIMKSECEWESEKIGLGAPPIKTNRGWLVVYHGVDKDKVYRLGIALFNLNNPTIIIKRQKEPILEPEYEWELKGDVPNVVFSCGAVLLDSELWVYYGGADKVIGLAKADVSEFLGI